MQDFSSQAMAGGGIAMMLASGLIGFIIGLVIHAGLLRLVAPRITKAAITFGRCLKIALVVTAAGFAFGFVAGFMAPLLVMIAPAAVIIFYIFIILASLALNAWILGKMLTTPEGAPVGFGTGFLVMLAVIAAYIVIVGIPVFLISMAVS